MNDHRTFLSFEAPLELFPGLVGNEIVVSEAGARQALEDDGATIVIARRAVRREFELHRDLRGDWRPALDEAPIVEPAELNPPPEPGDSFIIVRPPTASQRGWQTTIMEVYVAAPVVVAPPSIPPMVRAIFRLDEGGRPLPPKIACPEPWTEDGRDRLAADIRLDVEADVEDEPRKGDTKPLPRRPPTPPSLAAGD